MLFENEYLKVRMIVCDELNVTCPVERLALESTSQKLPRRSTKAIVRLLQKVLSNILLDLPLAVPFVSSIFLADATSLHVTVVTQSNEIDDQVHQSQGYFDQWFLC
jgi:hypothetical protein